MNQTNHHPSVDFQEGRVKDFRTACDTWVAQSEFELAEGRKLTHEATDVSVETRKLWQEQNEAWAKQVEEMKAAAKIAKAIYADGIIELADRIKAHDPKNQWLAELANALKSSDGDYSSLAL